MKFGQLMECNMRNVFLQKLYTKSGGETRDVVRRGQKGLKPPLKY